MSLPPQQPGQPVNPEYGRQPDPQQLPPGGGQPPQQAWSPEAQQQQWDAQQQWIAQQQAWSQQAQTQQGAPVQPAPQQSWPQQPAQGIQQNWQGQPGWPQQGAPQQPGWPQQGAPQQAWPQQGAQQQAWPQQQAPQVPPQQPGWPQQGAQQQAWPQQAAPQQGTPQQAAPPPAGPPQPISMSFGGSAGLVKGVGIGSLVIAAICLLQTVINAIAGDTTWIISAVIAAFLVLFGVVCLLGVRNIRGAGLAIGPDGIQASLQGKTVRLAWSEIAYVGISITSSGFDGPGAPPVPSRLRGRSVIRIRLAGVNPGFADRPDLRFLATNDEQEPYTHKLPIMKPAALGDERFGLIDPVARALSGFGGSRFTGVEQKRVAVGRYS